VNGASVGGSPAGNVRHFGRIQTLTKEETQLPQRSRVMLRVIKHLAKSLKITQGHSNVTLEYSMCNLVHSNYVSILYRF